jgi:glycosyltransferase involved in cell wall biosynthesis
MVTAFTVVIPTYGRQDYLEEALRSVAEQTVDSVETIIVDDASPDPVALPRWSSATLIRAEANGGAARARNIGVGAASGDALAFLDDDDTWLPTRLEDAARALERAPIGVVGQGGRTRNLHGNVHHEILDATTPSLGATAIRRDRWVPLDDSYRSCEDLVWWLQVTPDNEVHAIERQGLRVRRHSGERVGYGARQRIADSYRLLDEFANYFREHPRAAAFRLRRIGLMHRSLGNHRDARAAHLEALRLQPNLGDARHLLRNVRPTAATRDDGAS